MIVRNCTQKTVQVRFRNLENLLVQETGGPRRTNSRGLFILDFVRLWPHGLTPQ